MGRYFGISNSTKKQSVSSYWKGDGFCDCYHVMHQLRWDKEDDIQSGCYDTINVFKYDETINDMVYEDKTDEIMFNNNKDDDRENDDSFEETNEIKEEEDKTKSENSCKKYGFNEKLLGPQLGDRLNHVPDWDGDVCKTCKYYYDNSRLDEYSGNFDPVFFMN